MAAMMLVICTISGFAIDRYSGLRTSWAYTHSSCTEIRHMQRSLWLIRCVIRRDCPGWGPDPPRQINVNPHETNTGGLARASDQCCRQIGAPLPLRKKIALRIRPQRFGHHTNPEFGIRPPPEGPARARLISVTCHIPRVVSSLTHTAHAKLSHAQGTL